MRRAILIEARGADSFRAVDGDGYTVGYAGRAPGDWRWRWVAYWPSGGGRSSGFTSTEADARAKVLRAAGGVAA